MTNKKTMNDNLFGSRTIYKLIIYFFLFTCIKISAQNYKVKDGGADSITLNFKGIYVKGFYRGTYINKINDKKGFYPHGKGTFYAVVNGNPTEYSGDFFEGVISGVGEIKGGEWKYVGSVSDGTANGDGELIWYQESFVGVKSIKGFFKDFKINGNILIEYSNGANYKGEAVNSLPEGQGKLTNGIDKPNNIEYILGAFINGQANGIVEIKYNSDKIYKGEFINGKYNGFGKLENFNLNSKSISYSKYEGYWKDDLREGNGITSYNNGDKLEGIWKNDLFYGSGKKMLEDSSYYDGEWKGSKPNGKGIQTTKIGSFLSGQFEDGKFSGNGKWVYKNGAIYEGDWKDDLRNGKGKITWADGAIYEGDWKDDKRNGKGKYTWVNGDVYEGDWKGSEYINGVKKNIDGTYESGIWNEKREFSGQAKRISGNKSIWEGEWVGLIPVNNGKVNFENGNFYEGEWDGKLENNYYSWNINGQGIMKYQNGDVYNGSWLLGIKSGQGEMSYKNGTSYRGEWVNDLPNGQGEFLQTDDKVLSGKFVNGVFQKPFLCKEVEIGSQIWMAENLTVAKFRNGDVIPQVKTLEEFKRANGPAWCYYEFSESNGVKYGKLYNWYAVNDPRGLAPIGWRIPSPSDFEEMKAFSPENRSYLKDAENPYFISSNNDMPNKIISDIKSKTGWDKNGTNASGFNALPAGFLEYGGYFSGKGSSTYFWTSMCCTAFDSSASALQLDKYTSNIPGNKSKNCCFSVRCIKEQ